MNAKLAHISSDSTDNHGKTSFNAIQPYKQELFKGVVAYWKVKTPCHAHGECIN